MLQISFTPEEREKLHYERFNHPHPFVQKKMEVLYLKSLDRKLPHELISDIANVSQNTMLSYFADYQTGEIEELTGIKRGLTQTAKFIKKLGMKLRKVGSIPGKAITESKKTNKRNSKQPN